MERMTAYQLRSNGVEVLFEDPHILVCSKPSGLLVLPDRYNAAAIHLIGLLTEAQPEMMVVHRLDKDTSGVIVFAKTKEAHAALNAQFEGRDVEKVYHAVCRGAMAQDDGTIDEPIGEHPRVAGRMRVDRTSGKPSVTDYRVLERFQGYVLIEARPHTGRTHQIRVHLAAIGLPILGDSLYGDRQPYKLSDVKRNYREGAEGEKPLLARTALHALRLSLNHPATTERMTFEAQLPKDMRSVLQSLRKYAPAYPLR